MSEHREPAAEERERIVAWLNERADWMENKPRGTSTSMLRAGVLYLRDAAADLEAGNGATTPGRKKEST